VTPEKGAIGKGSKEMSQEFMRDAMACVAPFCHEVLTEALHSLHLQLQVITYLYLKRY
jgi:hypothetical protein